jgi:hypothetical protein
MCRAGLKSTFKTGLGEWTIDNARAKSEGIIILHSPEPVLNGSLRPAKHIFIPIHKYLFVRVLKEGNIWNISDDFEQ